MRMRLPTSDLPEHFASSVRSQRQGLSRRAPAELTLEDLLACTTLQHSEARCLRVSSKFVSLDLFVDQSLSRLETFPYAELSNKGPYVLVHERRGIAISSTSAKGAAVP